VQQLLDSRPEADLAVFAVWVNVLGSDARRFWDPSILSDQRVANLWDTNGAIARWFGKRDGSGFAWDVYYVLGLEGGLKATEPRSSGGPVVARTDQLRGALGALSSS
jgi:hypothetical protein